MLRQPEKKLIVVSRKRSVISLTFALSSLKELDGRHIKKDVDSLGHYWSVSYYDSDRAFCLYFSGSNLDPHFDDPGLSPSQYNSRFLGFSVRLVSSAQ